MYYGVTNQNVAGDKSLYEDWTNPKCRTKVRLWRDRITCMSNQSRDLRWRHPVVIATILFLRDLFFYFSTSIQKQLAARCRPSQPGMLVWRHAPRSFLLNECKKTDNLSSFASNSLKRNISTKVHCIDWSHRLFVSTFVAFWASLHTSYFV